MCKSGKPPGPEPKPDWTNSAGSRLDDRRRVVPMADSSTRVLFTGTERVETTALVMVEWRESGG